MKEEGILTTEGIEASTYKELTPKDWEELVVKLNASKPPTPSWHLNEHTIPFWHQEGILQSILDTYDIIINSSGYDMLIELGYIKLKDASTDKKS